MRLARARLLPYRLPLLRPLETVHGVIEARAGCLLELESDTGELGRGDASPFPGFGMEPPEDVMGSLRALVQAVRAFDPRDGSARAETVIRAAPNASGSRFALDCALLEMAARAEGAHVAEHLATASGHVSASSVRVNALVSGGEAAEVAASARQALEDGFLDLKLKVGARSWEEDRSRISALRETVGMEIKIRLDAGGSWPADAAFTRLEELADFQIDFLEQPLSAADLQGMAKLRKRCSSLGIALAVDEAIVRPEDAQRVIESESADLLILKPAALGGVSVASKLAARARRAGLNCVVTTLIDSAWGRAAALSLACALPGSRPADGLATGSLLALDLADGPRPRAGRLERPDGSGWGLDFKPADLEKVSDGSPQEFEL